MADANSLNKPPFVEEMLDISSGVFFSFFLLESSHAAHNSTLFVY